MSRHEYVSDFAIFKLTPLLDKLGCSPAEQARAVAFFWTNGDRWDTTSPASFKSEAEKRLQALTGKRLPPESAPAPTPEPAPDNHDTGWKGPCRKYGGTYDCPRCTAEQKTAAGKRHAGAMKCAEEMFQQHRKFVLSRLDKEVPAFTGGRNARGYANFSDLENDIWQHVATQIDGFKPNPKLSQNGMLAWLTTVVHSQVVNHFRDGFREKRDVRKERQFDPKTHDVANPDSPVSVPAKPTAVPIKPENDK